MSTTLARRDHLAGLDLARLLFARNVALTGCDPREDHPALLQGERVAVARAVPARRREFAAGRAAARRAMDELGLPPAPVLMGADRAPVWPDDIIGSISHCRTCCLAAVARRGDVQALGLDVEDDTPLEDDLIASICTPSERAWLSTQPRSRAGQWAKVMFSAKEAAYKCQYMLTRRLFGFDGLEIALDPAAGRFEVRFTATVAPFMRNTRLAGRFAIGGGLIVTGMALAA